MDIQHTKAIAALSDDELKTLLVRRYPIADPNKIEATRDQLESAVLEILKSKAA